MNKLIKKTCVFILIGFLLSYLIIGASIKFYPEKFLGNLGEYSMWKFQSNKICSTKSQHLNLIIGDSRGMSDINPIYLSHNYRNFSVGGATFFEGFQTLKRMLEGKNKIDTVILCYGQFHYELSDVFHERTLPFGFINNDDLLLLNKIEKETNCRINYKGPGRQTLGILLKRFLLLNRNPIVYQSTFIDNLQNNYYSQGIAKMIQSLRLNRGHTLFGQADSASNVSQEALEVEFIPNKVLEYYLDSIFTIGRHHGIKILLATPPLSSLTYTTILKKQRKGYLDSYDSYLLSLSQKYKCKIVNYTTIFDNYLFGDPSHLNELGCKKYTENIRKITR
jgi:hypothetical protein